MICPYCQTNNYDNARNCASCGSPLQQGYQQPGQQGYQQQGYQPPPEKKSSVCLIVGIIVAVLAVLFILIIVPGVLYVWVTSLADTSETVSMTLELRVDDAADTAEEMGDATSFEKGEAILAVSQLGGNPIRWGDYNMRLSIQGSDSQYDLEVISINGNAFSPMDYSETGDIIIMGLASSSDDGAISAGNYVMLRITTGTDTVWSSANAVKVN